MENDLGIDAQRMRAAMQRYLGGDVHAASVTFSVIDAAGKEIRRDVVETNGKALVGYLRQLAGTLHLCIEEGEWSQWLYEILSPHVAELVVYRGEWKPGVKSDAIDARGLAEKLRTGGVGHSVYKNAKQFTALRDRARVYTMVTRDVARVKIRFLSGSRHPLRRRGDLPGERAESLGRPTAAGGSTSGGTTGP